MRKALVYLRPVASSVVGLILFAGSPKAARADGVYFVKQGDSIYRISKVFGVGVDQILEVNGLKSPDIKPGDRLRIPEQAIASSFAPAGAEPHRQTRSEEVVRRILCRQETVYHKVAKGETLTAISRRYGTTIDDLRDLNDLKRRARLSIGQKLVVRREGPKTHVVRRGDTLGRIASRFDTTADELMRINDLASTRIAPGQRLLLEACEQIAGGGAPVPTPPSVEAGNDPTEILTAIAEASAMAAVEARDRHDATEAANPLAAPRPPAAPPGITQRIINLAKTMLDIPYRFGGTTTRGIDCSAYVQRVFGLIDVALPRTAREQFKIGETVGRDDLNVGDLVFFRTYASFPSHVGIYLGDNLFIHASSVAKKVTIDSLDERYYTRRFLGGRRLPAVRRGEDLASAE